MHVFASVDLTASTRAEFDGRIGEYVQMWLDHPDEPGRLLLTMDLATMERIAREMLDHVEKRQAALAKEAA